VDRGRITDHHLHAALRTAGDRNVVVAAVVISIVALGFSAFAVIQGERRARADERQRRAVGPDAEALRDAVIDVRGVFEAAVQRGRDKRYWRKERGALKTLRDNAGRALDRDLGISLGAIIATWDEAAQAAPPSSRIRPGNMPDDPTRAPRLTDVQRIAGLGVAHCGVALDRLNALEAGR
jgi:hypothetical protein